MTEADKVILLVEDSPDDVELTRRALRKNNITNRLVVASDGAEAIEYLFDPTQRAARGRRSWPVLILLDLKLPRVDGLEVLRRRQADPRTQMIPVVVLTSSQEEQDLVRSYRLGANSYIRKPVDFQEFSETVRQMGQYWLTLNQLPRKTDGAGA
ncbi:MAG: response regulator [Phycisphaerae bacterium]|nr:response regulator [Phycisphaerae bacterium]